MTPTTLNGVTVYSAPEAAEYLNISTALARRLCQRGDLPAEKITGAWVIEAEALKTFAAGYVPGKWRTLRNSSE